MSWISNLFSRIPEIQTKRLLLRKILVTDAYDMFAYSNQPEVTEYLLWDTHPNPEHTKQYLMLLQERYRDGKYYDWAIVDKKSQRMIGTCGFSKIVPEHKSAEIGYVINPAFRGNGYAVEAAKAVLSFAFVKMKLNRVEARCMEGNEASERVMKKLGMTYEGMAREEIFVKGKYRNIKSYAVLRSEWKEEN